MRLILLLLSGLSFLAGGLIFFSAQSAIHEIEAFILFLIAAVFVVGFTIVDAIVAAREKIGKTLQSSFSAMRAQSGSAEVTSVANEQPGSAAAKHEEYARTLLAQARQLSKDGQGEVAITSLRELISRYPETTAAAKARQTLKKNGISV